MSGRPLTGTVVAGLPAREAYRIWAPTYGVETVVSAIDDRAVSRLSPPLAERWLLDAGCGTARRLRAVGGVARRAVGIDLVPEMLLADPAARAERCELAAADVRSLPFGAGVFDLLWCRLVLGHVTALDAAYAELARVAGRGARLVVTDFHPAASAAGHTRSFRDPHGVLRAVAHHVHEVTDHRRAAAVAGWKLTAVQHFTPGAAERPLYERAGRLADYASHRSLPLVLALCLAR